jgi:hypothetical protein
MTEMPDPKLIDSEHNGMFTRDGITVDVCICRLEDTKWTLGSLLELNAPRLKTAPNPPQIHEKPFSALLGADCMEAVR